MFKVAGEFGSFKIVYPFDYKKTRFNMLTLK